jgi:hypothetical protein
VIFSQVFVSGGTPANSNIACVSSLDRTLGYR